MYTLFRVKKVGVFELKTEDHYLFYYFANLLVIVIKQKIIFYMYTSLRMVF